MGISDTSCMIDGLPLLYWRWNLGKSGQSWDYENRTTEDQLMMDNAGIKKSPTTLGEIVGLHNCAVA